MADAENSTTTEPTGEEVIGMVETVMDHLAHGGSLKDFMKMGREQMEAIYAVGYNHMTAHKYDQAADLFRFLCLNDHTEPRWYYALGVARQKKGDFAHAVEAYAMATLLDIHDPQPQAQAGYCLMALDKLPEAQNAFEGAIIACGDGFAKLRGQIEAMLETVKTRQAGSEKKEG